MSTAIEGVLVALGTPPDSTQPRALVHCTVEQIRAVETAAMMQPVTILATAELTSLRGRLRAWEEAFETTNPAQAKAEHGAVLEKRAALQREIAQANGKLDRLKSFGRFADLLARHGVVDPLAVQDPEGYDGGATLSRISKAHEEIWASL